MKTIKETSKNLSDTIKCLHTVKNKKLNNVDNLSTEEKKSFDKNEQKKIDQIRQWIIESIMTKPWHKQ